MEQPITLTLTKDEIQRVLEAVKRDTLALLAKVEGQANAQILAAAVAPDDKDA